ncbi:MAG: LuxR C-terminal-related transcriptional regulator [Pseudoclavibacter sp.]
MDDGCFHTSRADRVLAGGSRALAIEFPDLGYVERCLRLWSERHDLTIGVWRPFPGAPEAPVQWLAASEHARRPDSLSLVLVPDGRLDQARQEAMQALPAQRRDEFAWMPAADLFLTDADIEHCQSAAEPPVAPRQVRARVGCWPELVPIETGTTATRGNVESAIHLILESAALPPRHARFLQHCAVPEILTVNARDTVWADPDREELTRWALDRGWITRCDDPALLGLIPSHWRTVLLAALEREEPGATARLSLPLSEGYAAHGASPDILLRQAQRTGDQHLVARILAGHLLALATDHGKATATALAALPPDLFAAYPAFALAQELLANALTPPGIRERRSTPPAPDDTSRTPLIAAARLMLSNRLAGRVHKAAQSAALLRQIAERPGPDGTWPTRDDTDMTLLHCGITALLDGDFAQATIDLEHAFQGWAGTPGFVQRDALGKLALIHALQGELGTAERQLREAASYPLIASPFRSRALVSERIAGALIAAEHLDVPEVRRAWDAGWLKPDYEEELWPFVLFIGQRCASVMGAEMLNLHFADAMLHRTRTEHDEYRTALAQTARAENLIALGNLAEARACLSQIRAHRAGQFGRLASVRLALHAGHPEETARLATALSLQAQSLGVRVEALYLGASALWQLGQHAQAVRLVRSASVAAEAEGMKLPMLAVPAAISEALFAASGVTGRPHSPDGAGLRRGPGLTPALRGILAALTTTGSAKQIAVQLHLSQNTVKTHLRRLYRILGVHSRDDALAEAARLGLLS